MSLDKQQIARQFTRAAETYDDVAQLQSQMADNLIDQISEHAAGTLIDLGCGTGLSLEKIANQFELELIGIDLSPGMIAHAKKRFAQMANRTPAATQGPPNIEFHIADLENSSLPNASAEIVFSNAAIQWCDSGSAFAEMARILKPNGQLLLTTFGPKSLQQWKQGWQAIGDLHSRVHEFETPSSLQSSLSAAGFKFCQLESELHELRFDSVKSMFAGIKRLGATNAMSNRPTGLLGRNRYLRLCEYFEKELSQSGFLTITFECISISAIC